MAWRHLQEVRDFSSASCLEIVDAFQEYCNDWCYENTVDDCNYCLKDFEKYYRKKRIVELRKKYGFLKESETN